MRNHPTGAGKTAHRRPPRCRSQATRRCSPVAAGHGYGALDLFYFYKDGPTVPFPKRMVFPATGVKAMLLRGLSPGRLMRRPVRAKRPWYKMIPDQSAIASEQGEGTQRSSRAEPKDGSFRDLPTHRAASR